MDAAPLSLGERIVIADARGRLETLSGAIDQLPAGAPARLDAQALAQFDTGALALLLALRRHCERAGRPLQVTGVPARLRGLAALYGVDGVLGLA